MDDLSTVTWAQRMPDRLNQPGATTIATDSPAVGGKDGVPSSTNAAARYVIIGEAGKGGMAVVHVARDNELLRRVALKAMAADARGNEDMQVRFLREAQITAQLDHPHVVPVYALEAASEGLPAYTMKLIEGRTFSDYLDTALQAHQQGRQPDDAHALPARLEHFLKVCDAVAYAHSKGVVHRDLKPANIMIGRHNEVYVMDWGICRVLGQSDDATVAAGVTPTSGDAGTTQAGAVVGTPRYMAPEQAQGLSDAIGPHTDQCSLGLMLHELVTLGAPFAGRTAMEVLENAAHGRVRSMTPVCTGIPVPGELKAIVARATAYEPDQRYPSVRAFAADIRRYLRGEAVEARPDNPWQKAARFLSRHRQLAMLALLSVIAAAATAISLLQWQHERAMVAEREREQRLGTLVELVARHGDRLQTRMLILQGELDALAGMASQLLQHGRESDERIYWVEDYRRADRMPADFGVHPGYEDPVSLQHGVWTVAPGVTHEAVESEVRRLLHLRRYGAELFEHVRGAMGTVGPADNQVAQSGVAEFMVALESGVTYRYPGFAEFREGFDGRLRPWYRPALSHPRAVWGRPYVSAVGGAIKLPVSHAMREPGGPLLGVVSLTLKLNHLVRNLQMDQAHPAVREVMLLDADGMVVAAASMLRPQALDGDELTLVRFPDTRLFERLEQGDIGHFETQVFGAREIVAFDRVDPLGWVVVAIADAEALLATPL
ncbi:MAG TPA: serine/threonine protein kinase [Xanthomonadaceae bacterium]|nr:serine/threonine protein kinase [Xanthomonadaceae bacterium]